VLFACTLFMVAGIGCALARSLPTLLAWRFVQGAGADASMTIALAIIRELFEGAVGVTTRKCSECTTSWTKHERAARWYVRSTLDGCRSGGGRRHVSDVPRASVYRGLSRTAAVDPQATFVSLNGEDGPCPFPVIRWCRQGLGASDESIPSASVNYSVSEIRLGEVR
jgi:hypothetical protein